jgi:Bacterial regulatory proteins, lacI family
MATILELANFAGVSAENVLRVIHDEPVSEEVAARVAGAIDALGPSPSARPTPEVLPAETNGNALERSHEELLERFAAAAAELEAGLPQGVGSVVYEALRVEVRPVAQEVAELGSLFERMVARLEDVGGDLATERRERVEDVALLAELITTGWRTVDRRLGRIEQMLARMEERQTGTQTARVIRLDEHPNRSASGD